MFNRRESKREKCKGEVLIDGWTLLSVFDQIAEPTENVRDDISKLCMGYFTTAIILWDKLSYPIGGTFPESLDEYLPDNELGTCLKKLLNSEYHILNEVPPICRTENYLC